MWPKGAPDKFRVKVSQYPQFQHFQMKLESFAIRGAYMKSTFSAVPPGSS
jgi:hypothetical protein